MYRGLRPLPEAEERKEEKFQERLLKLGAGHSLGQEYRVLAFLVGCATEVVVPQQKVGRLVFASNAPHKKK